MLGAQVSERLAKDAITLPAEALDLPPEAEVGHYLGGDLADGAEFATFGRVCWAPH